MVQLKRINSLFRKHATYLRKILKSIFTFSFRKSSKVVDLRNSEIIPAICLYIDYNQ